MKKTKITLLCIPPENLREKPKEKGFPPRQPSPPHFIIHNQKVGWHQRGETWTIGDFLTEGRISEKVPTPTWGRHLNLDKIAITWILIYYPLRRIVAESFFI